ncbi:MAG: hypothetical protein Q8N60_04090 [Candidatus Diapherotrites archaeon]|nr:hypothetical protein [Candidatus Diapherotrites archaeon]
MPLTFLISFFSGLAAKLTDDLVDKKPHFGRKIKYFTAVAYGLLAGYLISSSAEFATLFLAVIAAVLLAGKIDDAAHFLAIIAIAAMVVLLGLPGIIPAFFVFFLAFAFLDEALPDIAAKKFGRSKKKQVARQKIFGEGEKQAFGQKFLGSRFWLDIACFVLSLALNNWVYFFAIASFDIGYNAVAFAGIIKSP